MLKFGVLLSVSFCRIFICGLYFFDQKGCENVSTIPTEFMAIMANVCFQPAVCKGEEVVDKNKTIDRHCLNK